jgi:uncharacterized damage-inducible protein DinB
MKKKYIIKLIDYELWANNMILKAIAEARSPDERVYELASHILISSNTWLKRILDQTPEFNLWDKLTLENCHKLSQENYENWRKVILIKPEDKLEQHIFFQFKGSNSKLSLEDLFLHIVNHSSYHRGQIIIKLKGKLDQLPLTTYIAFATEKV